MMLAQCTCHCLPVAEIADALRQPKCMVCPALEHANHQHSLCETRTMVQVAACICLFALDKHEAIPVDTHVWQLAVRYYTPHLKGMLGWLYMRACTWSLLALGMFLWNVVYCFWMCHNRLHRCNIAQAAPTGSRYVCPCDDSRAFANHARFCNCAIQAVHGTACGRMLSHPLPMTSLVSIAGMSHTTLNHHLSAPSVCKPAVSCLTGLYSEGQAL